jgi:hypothetical protein
MSRSSISFEYFKYSRFSFVNIFDFFDISLYCQILHNLCITSKINNFCITSKINKFIIAQNGNSARIPKCRSAKGHKIEKNGRLTEKKTL